MPPTKRAKLGTQTLRGVVTWSSGPKHPSELVVDDGTGGIFVRVPEAHGSVAAGTVSRIPTGTELEVSGIIRGPLYEAPRLSASHLRVLGESPLPKAKLAGPLRDGSPRPALPSRAPGNSPLPEPKPPSPFFVEAGRSLFQRLEVRGMIKRVEPMGHSTAALTIANGKTEFKAQVKLSPKIAPEQLIGCWVCVRGTIMGIRNNRQELIGFTLITDRPEDLITVHATCSQDPFQATEVPINEFHLFSESGFLMARGRTTGTVTSYFPGHCLFLRKDGRTVRIETTSQIPLEIGDLAEASGFFHLCNGVVGMQNAAVRKIGCGKAPVPVDIDVADVFGDRGETTPGKPRADLDWALVRLNARLANLQETEMGHRLLLESSNIFVMAELDTDDGGALHHLRAGSQITATGIAAPDCEHAIGLGTFTRPTAMTLLLRSADDVRIIKAAPWWTPKRLTIALLASVGLAGTLAIWTLLLARRVRRHTLALAQKSFDYRSLELEQETMLRERSRIAAELHDGVQQLLAGVSFHIGAADGAPDNSRKHIAKAHGILAKVSEEFRTCIWALRQMGTAETDPARSLRSVAALQRQCSDTEIDLRVEGIDAPLPPPVMTALSLTAREAMCNAVRHGSAKHVALLYRRDEGGVTLEVSDDGSGFTPTDGPDSHWNRFGLTNMLQRIHALGGTLDIDSQPGRGARIIVHIPATALEAQAPLQDSDPESILIERGTGGGDSRFRRG